MLSIIFYSTLKTERCHDAITGSTVGWHNNKNHWFYWCCILCEWVHTSTWLNCWHELFRNHNTFQKDKCNLYCVLFLCNMMVVLKYMLLGVYWFPSVHPSICLPSVRLSIHPSCIPCPLCSTYSSGWIYFIFIHPIKQLQKMCCKISKF